MTKRTDQPASVSNIVLSLAVALLFFIRHADASRGQETEPQMPSSDESSATIITIAGTGFPFYNEDNIAATRALLGGPSQIAIDSHNNLYIADTKNHRIRKIDSATGLITTVVGTGETGDGGDDGPATEAQLHSPVGVTVDGNDNLYITDIGSHRIRMVEATTGIITTVAGTGQYGYFGNGGPANRARLGSPTDVAIDDSGNLFFAAGHRIRKVSGVGAPEGTSRCSYFLPLVNR
ncbi:hypothetical protein KFU94_14355 [Chloroflexi bacterium TSY]|nr:hypothetical protein [Chloroflexi bacterium TSY]